MLAWIQWICSLIVPHPAELSAKPALIVTPYITFIDSLGNSRELPLNSTALEDWNDSVAFAEFRPNIPGDAIKGYISYAPSKGDAFIWRYANSQELTDAFRRIRAIPNRIRGDYFTLWKLSFAKSDEKIPKIQHFLELLLSIARFR